jgi:hypothetical protein
MVAIAMAGGTDNNQLKSAAKTVAVATAMKTAAAGAATTAAGAPTTALGVGADGIAFATAWEGCGCWL